VQETLRNAIHACSSASRARSALSFASRSSVVSLSSSSIAAMGLKSVRGRCGCINCRGNNNVADARDEQRMMRRLAAVVSSVLPTIVGMSGSDPFAELEVSYELLLNSYTQTDYMPSATQRTCAPKHCRSTKGRYKRFEFGVQNVTEQIWEETRGHRPYQQCACDVGSPEKC
jgi:hypothetical protein